MDYVSEPLLIAAILFAAAALQSAIGFAIGMFAIPLLLWAGCSLPTAVALVLISSLVQSLVGALRLRTEIRWQEAISATGYRLLGLPFGLAALALADSLGTELVRQVVGMAILGLVALQWSQRSTMVAESKPAAFFSSGYLLGMLGMGGPTMALWVLARDWQASRMRAFMFAVNLLTLPVNLVLLGLTFSGDSLRTLSLGLTFCPVAMVGAAAGLRLAGWLPRGRLRLAAYSVLGVLGITAAL
ncbi:MAG: sulfite exporter TauE/SafE family protein [Armatimonadetes bacterium]|nr:sulfite exporter TauE/SafE family protein [Armatimonadota bacterium]